MDSLKNADWPWRRNGFRAGSSLRQFLLMLLAASLSGEVWGQIVIGPEGSGLLTFDAAPSAQEWATQSFGGDNGGTGIMDAATLDAQVQLVSASEITTALATTAAVPPVPNNYARWNSRGAFLQSRIGSNEFTVLMASLINNSETVLQTVDVSYDLGGGAFSSEQIPGFRGYYSFTGEPGSWQLVPEFCTGATGRVTALLSFPLFPDLALWFPGMTLYLLWADDNGMVSDGYYTIDNFRVTVAPALNIRAAADGKVEVSWPVGWWNHSVEVSASLSEPHWQGAIGPDLLSEGLHHLLLDAKSGSGYFRTRSEVIIP